MSNLHISMNNQEKNNKKPAASSCQFREGFHCDSEALRLLFPLSVPFYSSFVVFCDDSLAPLRPAIGKAQWKHYLYCLVLCETHIWKPLLHGIVFIAGLQGAPHTNLTGSTQG
jgi:hypothetical protein